MLAEELWALFFPKLRFWRVAKHEAIFGVCDVRMTDWRMYTHANGRICILLYNIYYGHMPTNSVKRLNFDLTMPSLSRSWSWSTHCPNERDHSNFLPKCLFSILASSFGLSYSFQILDVSYGSKISSKFMWTGKNLKVSKKPTPFLSEHESVWIGFNLSLKKPLYIRAQSSFLEIHLSLQSKGHKRPPSSIHSETTPVFRNRAVRGCGRCRLRPRSHAGWKLHDFFPFFIPPFFLFFFFKGT